MRWSTLKRYQSLDRVNKIKLLVGQLVGIEPITGIRMATFINLLGQLAPVQKPELFFQELAVEDLFAGFGDAPSRAVAVKVHGQATAIVTG